MKVAVCVNHYHPLVGGAEEVASRISNHLAKDHDVYVLTRRVRDRNHADYDNLSVIEYMPGDVSTFMMKMKKISPNVILIYSDVFDFFRHLITEGFPGSRLFVALCGANWIHRSERNFTNLFVHSLKNIEKVICHSKFERDYKLCSSKASSKMTIIPNGVDLSEFDENELTREDLAPDIADRRWVLNVSNFFPGKGQEHLVDILSELPNHKEIAYIQVSNDIAFTVGANLEVRWRKLVAAKLNDRGIATRLMKNLPRDQVVGFFKNSNVLPFTSEKEVAPLVLLEAMAGRLPWLSMNVGNSSELKGGKVIKAIKDAAFNSVFDVRVKRQFLDGIEDYFKTTSVIQDGRDQIESTFNWEVILPQYSKLIT